MNRYRDKLQKDAKATRLAWCTTLISLKLAGTYSLQKAEMEQNLLGVSKRLSMKVQVLET